MIKEVVGLNPARPRASIAVYTFKNKSLNRCKQRYKVTHFPRKNSKPLRIELGKNESSSWQWHRGNYSIVLGVVRLVSFSLNELARLHFMPNTVPSLVIINSAYNSYQLCTCVL